jgi:hypothetical protein
MPAVLVLNGLTHGWSSRRPGRHARAAAVFLMITLAFGQVVWAFAQQNARRMASLGYPVYWIRFTIFMIAAELAR